MKMRWVLVVMGLGFGSGSAWADIFHYNNIIVGDRAMGLGGAYTAIADDASGVFYNPAGLGFALSNDISGSANAFYTKKTEYKNVIGNESFTEESGGSVAPFFGGLQKLDNLSSGMVMAFGIATLDSDLKDQNDEIINKTIKTKLENGSINEGEIDRFHRTVMQRASSNALSIGLAKRLSGSFSIGIGLSYLSADELVQEYQDVQAGSNGNTTRLATIQNIRDILSMGAIEPSLGVQWAFANSWSLGFVVKVPQVLFQSRKVDRESTNYSFNWQCLYEDSAGQDQLGPAGKKCAEGTADGTIATDGSGYTNVQTGIAYVLRDETTTKTDNPLGDLPMVARLGLAWFATPRLLLSFDASHHTEAKDGDDPLFEREAVTNFNYGMEYYITPSLPLRFGLFTNNDSRPELSSSKANQRDHIDYLGSSLFLAWAQPNSQVALGVVVQSGSGEAQKIGNNYLVQDVSALALTGAFSATHNF